MIKYATIIDDNTKSVAVGIGEDTAYYASIGMKPMDVEQAHNGLWYLVGYAPAEPAPTVYEQVTQLEKQYEMNRWQREGILAEGSLYSPYTKQKAQEIEDLAKELRNQEN